VECALKIGSMQWLMDGECVGDRFIAFDLLRKRVWTCGQSLPQTFGHSVTAMPVIGKDQAIQFIRTATKTSDKRAMLAELRQQNREGIVFNADRRKIHPGRPASGGDQRKLKIRCGGVVYRRRNQWQQAQRGFGTARRRTACRCRQCDHPTQSGRPCGGEA